MSKVVRHWTLELVLKLLSGPRGENHGCLEMRSLKTCGIRLGMPSITWHRMRVAMGSWEVSVRYQMMPFWCSRGLRGQILDGGVEIQSTMWLFQHCGYGSGVGTHSLRNGLTGASPSCSQCGIRTLQILRPGGCMTTTDASNMLLLKRILWGIQAPEHPLFAASSSCWGAEWTRDTVRLEKMCKVGQWRACQSHHQSWGTVRGCLPAMTSNIGSVEQFPSSTSTAFGRQNERFPPFFFTEDPRPKGTWFDFWNTQVDGLTAVKPLYTCECVISW